MLERRSTISLKVEEGSQCTFRRVYILHRLRWFSSLGLGSSGDNSCSGCWRNVVLHLGVIHKFGIYVMTSYGLFPSAVRFLHCSANIIPRL